MGDAMTTTAIRVRWGEVDGQGVVFNANYLMYADVAVTEFMRANGVMTHCRDEFGQTFVVDAHLIFKASATCWRCRSGANGLGGRAMF